ncbi:MAG: CGNR zinc finger domain-containing protein [Nocardioidaceae bacterium]
MIYVEVDGQVLPQPLAGHPALELCNTWAGWNTPGEDGDYLTSYDTLAVWAREQQLLSAEQADRAMRAAGRSRRQAVEVLATTRELRHSLYWLLVDPDRDPEVGALAGLVEEAAAAQRLVLAADGGVTWQLREDNPVRLPLLAVAHAVGELLTGPERWQVHACPGHACGWLFLDPRGRRKWCSMAVCGNRAKVRAHAQRHGAAG